VSCELERKGPRGGGRWCQLSTGCRRAESGGSERADQLDSDVIGVREREWAEWLSASGGGCPQSWSTGHGERVESGERVQTGETESCLS